MLRPVVIRHYLALMEAEGHPADQILAGTGVDRARLDDAGFLIDTEQSLAVIVNMIAACGDDGVGLNIGLRTDLGALGIVGQASMTARTVRDTYSLWSRYGGTLAGALGKFETVAEDRSTLTLAVAPQRCNGAPYRFIVEELMTMTMANMLRLVGMGDNKAGPVFRKVVFSYAPPPYAHRYRELFGCPIEFGAARSGVVLDKAWFEKRLANTDDEFNRICLRHCAHVLHRIEHNQDVNVQLWGLFTGWEGALPKLEEAARALHLSARTLRRRLQQEGTNYRRVVEEFRTDRARELLKEGNISPKQAAYLLGFMEPGAFRRAFKGWTGQTVGEYRGQAQIASAPRR